MDNSYKWASGGVIGTSDDRVRFGLGESGESAISTETRKMFWTMQTNNSGDPTGYGLGWRITTDEAGHQLCTSGNFISFW